MYNMYVQYVQLFIGTATITWGKIEIETRTRTVIIIAGHSELEFE